MAQNHLKFLVDVFDETRMRYAPAGNAGETVAIATILRSRKLDQR